MHIFVTATDNNVGKNFITSSLAAIMQSLGYKTGVYEPISIGAIEQNNFLISNNLAYIKKLDPYIETLNTYAFKTLALPPIAAELENITINTGEMLKDFKYIFSASDCTITQGLGGIMTPLSYKLNTLGLIKKLSLPTVIITKPDLGCINKIIMSVNCAKEFGVKIQGVIINKYPPYTNTVSIKSVPRLIEEYTDSKVLGIVKDFGDASKIFPTAIIDNVLNSVDIEQIFDTKIPKLEIIN